ncbi:MAG: type II toxin-antitoxin system Phd/YefM family antitoxin [Burkholderiales bacterium]
MEKDYPIAQAKDQLTSLVRLAERGTLVRLTRRGKLVARIVSERDFLLLRGHDTAGLWAAIQRFREQTSFGNEDLDDETIAGWRDRTPGRQVKLSR